MSLAEKPYYWGFEARQHVHNELYRHIMSIFYSREGATSHLSVACAFMHSCMRDTHPNTVLSNSRCLGSSVTSDRSISHTQTSTASSVEQLHKSILLRINISGREPCDCIAKDVCRKLARSTARLFVLETTAVCLLTTEKNRLY